MTATVDLRSVAIGETRRLEARRLGFKNSVFSSSETLFLALQPERSSLLLALSGLIFIFRFRIVDGLGRLLEEAMLPVRLPIAFTARDMRHTDLLRRRVPILVKVFAQPASEAARIAGWHRARAIQRDHGRWLSHLEARERHLASAIARRHPVQPALFYRRPDQSPPSGHESASTRAGAEVTARPPHLVMLLLVGSGHEA